MGSFFKMNSTRPKNGLKCLKILTHILLLFLGLLSSCQKNPSILHKRQILRTCLAGDVSSLDPRIGVSIPTQGVVRMLFAGLVYLDQNLVPQLDLASSYRVSD